jgi:hypothetical protein
LFCALRLGLKVTGQSAKPKHLALAGQYSAFQGAHGGEDGIDASYLYRCGVSVEVIKRIRQKFFWSTSFPSADSIAEINALASPW